MWKQMDQEKKRHFRERLKNMSPEERKAFREKIKQRRMKDSHQTD
jgi:hypothetical protein